MSDGPMTPTAPGTARRMRWSRLPEQLRSPERLAAAETVSGLVLLLVLLVVRLADAERQVLLAWTWVACAAAVVSPRAGLVVLAGTLPFSEWLVFHTVIGAKAILIPFVAAGAVLRRPPQGPLPTPVRLALGLAAVTGGGVLLTAARFDPVVAEWAVHGWVAGLGGALLLLAVAWTSTRGRWVVPVTVLFVAIGVGAVLALVELVSPGLVRASPIGVLLRPPLDDLPRVTGLIPAPNAVATLFACAVAVAVPLLPGRSPRVAVPGWMLVAALVVATVLTYSRSGIASLLGILVLAVAVRNRRAGIGLAVGVAAGALILVPVFMAFRAQAMGVAVAFDLGAAISGDVRRFEGWTAAVAMFQASPVVGHGFGAFRELAFQYGSTYVTAPHNELLRLAAEGGLIALGVGAALLVSLAGALWRRQDAWGAAGCGVLVCLVLGGMFNNPFTYIQVVGPAGIILGTALAAHVRPIARPEAEPEP